jgi:AcrR family transcriptional regulator
MASPIARHPRKDAKANRAHVLDVAKRAFAEEGIDVSMDAIARKAEIGSATLYRNFPNKDALLAALLTPYHERLEERRIAIEQGTGDAGEKFQHWIDALADWMLVYEGLPEPLQAAWAAKSSPLQPACDDLFETTDRFLRAAQQGGFARPALSGRDVFLSLMAMAWAIGTKSAHANSRTTLNDILRNGWAQRCEEPDHIEQPSASPSRKRLSAPRHRRGASTQR